MNKNKYSLLLGTALLFLSALCAAQPGFLIGYVITNKGDTIKGKIKDRKYVNSTTSWQKIDFIDDNGKKYAYDPDEIKEYGRTGKPKYCTLTIGVEAQKTFLEVSEEGQVILYSYYRGTWGGAGNAILLHPGKKESKARIAFYLEIKGLPVYVADSKEHVECFLQFRNKPGSLMQWRPRDYKETAKVFFKDNTEIIQLLEDGTLNENDIYAIVKKYNEWKAVK